MESSKATVVITSYNQKECLVSCLQWLQEFPGIADIVIVDNGSTDGTSELLPKIHQGGFISTRDSKAMGRCGMPL